jgi:hypothetical protein
MADKLKEQTKLVTENHNSTSHQGHLLIKKKYVRLDNGISSKVDSSPTTSVIQRQWNFQQGGFITSNIFIYNSVT